MKHLKHLFTALLLLCSTVAFAHDFVVDGIYYNITSESNKTVEVTYEGNNYIATSKYHGRSLVIPETVTYNDVTYTVTAIGSNAFNLDDLKSLTIPKSVTKIGGFQDYNKDIQTLKAITVEEGNPVFDSRDNCNAIIETATNTLIYGSNSTVIPESVTNIGQHAFYGCTGLKNITIPQGVTSIGYGAFYGCTGLTSVTIPEGVTNISYNAFEGCKNLTTVVLPESLTYIGSSAFIECTGLTSITIPQGVTSIGFNTFYGCTGLTSITIPQGVTEIGSGTFYGCTGLTSITIPKGVTEIGSSAFKGCKNLTSITIPKGVTNIGDSPFEGCTGLTSIIVEDGNTVFDSRDNCNAIIETATNRLISGCMNTVIPNDITKIDFAAFSGHTGLTNIVIPNSVTTIDSYAFNGCRELTSITIPASVTAIGDYAFYGCYGLTTVTSIATMPPSIGQNTFNGGREMALNYPEGSNYITWGKYFSNFTIDYNRGTEWCIDDEGNAYAYGSGELYTSDRRDLKRVWIEEGFTSITDFCFGNCENLEEVYLPESMTTIGNEAFFYCCNLKEIDIPGSVTTIGERAFESCHNIKEIVLPVSMDSIGAYAFYECRELKKVVLPESLSTIKEYTFADCNNLKNILLPDNLITIGDYAFYNTDIDYIVIPQYLASLGNHAFYRVYNNTTLLVFKSFVAPLIGEFDSYCVSAYVPEGANSYPSEKFNDIKHWYAQSEFYYYGFELFIFGNADNLNAYETYIDKDQIEKVILHPAATGYNLISECPNITEVNVQHGRPKHLCLYTVDGSNAVFRHNENDEQAMELVAGCATTVIPEGTTSINENAFYNCSGLKNIEIPNTVTNISYNAFYGCSGLSGITIPNSVSYIGWSAFENCTSLRNITLSENITQLHDKTFTRCSNLANIEIPNGIISIGDSIFKECIRLSSIKIPSTLSGIGRFAFDRCDALTSIDIDEGNPYIDSRDNCNSIISKQDNRLILALKNGFIPETVTSIGADAFTNKEEQDIDVPASVTSIEVGAFNKVKHVYLSSETPATITGDIGGNGVIYVPAAAYDTYCNADVWSSFSDRIVSTDIADKCVEVEATEGMSGVLDAIGLNEVDKVVKLKVIGSINSYDITVFRDKMPLLSELDLSEASVVASSKPFYQTYCTGKNSLGSYAFYDLDKLVSAKLPKELETLGDYAFNGCNRLKSVDASATGELNVGTCAFSNCNILEEVILPEKVSEIGSYSFQNCANLSTLKIDNITGSIGTDAFNRCNKMRDFKIGSIGGNIQKYAFRECSSVETVEIDSIGGNIEEDAFINSNNIEEIKIGVMSGNLQKGSLSDMANLKSIEFGKGPRVIGSKILDNCFKFESFVAGDGTIEVSSEAFDQRDKWGSAGFRSLKRVILPNTVQKIGDKAFYVCTKLSEFTMPKSVTSIGKEAFYICSSIDSIDIPEGVTTIPQKAFYGCYELRHINLSPNLTSIDSYAFRSCDIKELKLPLGLKSIGESAFNDCSKLTELHIPSSLETIGNNAFSGCSNLNSVYTYTVEPTVITESTFSTFDTATLYVPATSFWNYYWDIGWSRFNHKNFKEFNEVYKYFYLYNDYYLNSDRGYINGTPNADLKPGSGLIVEGDDTDSDDVKQNMGDVNLESDGDSVSSSIVADNNLHINKLNIKINVKGGRWYFFAFPFDIPFSKISMEGGSDYVFRYYDGNERAKNGEGGWKNVNESHLKAARGYIFQSYADDVLVLSTEDLDFKKEDKYNELVAHVSENLNDASWNFVGNPYLSYYDLADLNYTAPVTVWDGEKYVAIRPGDDDYHFTPYEAFFVQKPEDEATVGYDADKRMTKTQSGTKKASQAAARRTRGIVSNRSIVNLVFDNGEATDGTRVVFNEKQSHNYEMSCDAAKFDTEGMPQIYTMDNEGVRYAINERPVGNGVVFIGYTATTAGYYSIDVERMDKEVFLYDAETETKHYFDDGAYKFYSDMGTFENRFSLGVRNDATTSIEEIDMENDIEAVEGGIRFKKSANAIVYNGAGMLVATQNEVGTLLLPAGTYVVCIGDDSRKVVVK